MFGYRLPYLSHQEPFERIPRLQVHAPDHTAHQVGSHILHLCTHCDCERCGSVRHMENPHHHLVQLLHLILFLCHLLLLPLLLPFPLVCVATPVRLTPILPFPFSSEVVEDGLGLAAVDHLLQSFVAQLVAFEVDLLKLGAVAEIGGDLAQLVVGKIEHLEENKPQCTR